MITAALHLATTDGLREVLTSITGLTGFDVPGPAFRRWAVAAKNVTVAMVAGPEHICPRKTGLLVAAEQGLRVHICESEAAAVAWLAAAARLPSQPLRQTGGA